MTADEFKAMLESMARGWTARTYEKVAEHFAESVYYSDPLNYTLRDKKSLLEFFRNDDGEPQLCEIRDVVFDELRQIGAAEYTYEGTYRYHGSVWIELSDDKISSWREYQHKSEKGWEDFWNR